jgi:hypothetical protein
MTKKDPADFVIRADATIDDVDLDQEEIYYQGERLTEERAAQIGEESARLAREAGEAKT